jgi:hypothetical protein
MVTSFEFIIVVSFCVVFLRSQEVLSLVKPGSIAVDLQKVNFTLVRRKLCLVFKLL